MAAILQTIFSIFFLNENVWISIKVSLKFVHKGQIMNIPALVQIMAWRQPADQVVTGGFPSQKASNAENVSI